MGAISFSRGSSQLMIEPKSPTSQEDSLPLSYLGSPHVYILRVYELHLLVKAHFRHYTGQ